MYRRSFLRLSIAAGMAAAGLTGCDRAQPIHFGVHPWIGYEPLYLAEDFGWLTESVSLAKGAAADDSMAGLVNGTLDGAALTLDEALRVQDAGKDVVVVGVTDVSAGADVIMVQPFIQDLSELRGRRIAVELSGASGVMLVKTLERAGLSRGDITEVGLPVSEHLDAWRRGDIDASVCYEPTASKLENLGGNRLYDSSDLPETIFDVLVVTRAMADNNSDAVRDLLEAHFAGMRHLVRSRHDSVYRVASRQDTSHSAVERAMASVMFPDLTANQRYLAASGRVETIAFALAQMMVVEGMLSELPDLGRLCDPSFLPRSLS